MIIPGTYNSRESSPKRASFKTDEEYFDSFDFNLETVSRCFFGRETDIVDDPVL